MCIYLCGYASATNHSPPLNSALQNRLGLAFTLEFNIPQRSMLLKGGNSQNYEEQRKLAFCSPHNVHTQAPRFGLIRQKQALFAMADQGKVTLDLGALKVPHPLERIHVLCVKG